MFDFKRIDLIEYKKNPEMSVEILKQFIRNGKACLLLCKMYEADLAFEELHSIIKDNFAIVHIDNNFENLAEKYLIINYKINTLNDIVCHSDLSKSYPLDKPDIGYLFYIIEKGEERICCPPNSALNNIYLKSYVPFSYVSYEKRYFITYVNRKSLVGEKVKIVSGNSGSSSAVISLPIMQEFIRKLEIDNKSIDFYYNPTCKNYKLYPYIFNECTHCLQERNNKIISLSVILLHDQESIKQYGKIVHFIEFQNNYVSKLENKHIVCEMLDMLSFDKHIHTYINMLDNFKLPEKIISRYLQNDIFLNKKKHKYLVGIQFSSFTDLEHSHDDDNIFRKWPMDFISQFHELCERNQILLINLSPIAQELKNVISASHLSIGELYGIINSLDCVVGIDSICCHIASTLKISNITIWKEKEPVIPCTPNGGRNMLYIPPHSHHSFICDNGKPDDITALQLFNKTLEILKEI